MKKLLQKITQMAVILSPGAVYAAPPRLAEAGQIIERIFDIFIPVGGLFAVGTIVYGGYMWMVSGGDPARLKQAQGTITWAVIGLVFLVLFTLILQLVFDFLAS